MEYCDPKLPQDTPRWLCQIYKFLGIKTGQERREEYLAAERAARQKKEEEITFSMLDDWEKDAASGIWEDGDPRWMVHVPLDRKNFTSEVEARVIARIDELNRKFPQYYLDGGKVPPNCYFTGSYPGAENDKYAEKNQGR